MTKACSSRLICSWLKPSAGIMPSAATVMLFCCKYARKPKPNRKEKIRQRMRKALQCVLRGRFCMNFLGCGPVLLAAFIPVQADLHRLNERGSRPVDLGAADGRRLRLQQH